MGYKKSVFQSLAMVTQLGLCVVTPVLFCVFAGNYIDSRVHWEEGAAPMLWQSG